MVKDDFEFNYNKEKKKKIVLSDVHIEIIIKVVFFTLLVLGLIGIGVFFPIYISIYCWVITSFFIIYFILGMLESLFDLTGMFSKLANMLVVIAVCAGISNITNMIFMYHNLRNGGKEFIQKIDRSGNYSISLNSRDDKNKRKKFVINNKKYVITPVYGDKQFFIRKDGKYVLYLNNNLANQIKDINKKQQEDIKLELEKINKSSNLNNDDNLFYLIIAVSFVIFIFFAICKSK